MTLRRRPRLVGFEYWDLWRNPELLISLAQLFFPLPFLFLFESDVASSLVSKKSCYDAIVLPRIPTFRRLYLDARSYISTFVYRFDKDKLHTGKTGIDSRFVTPYLS